MILLYRMYLARYLNLQPIYWHIYTPVPLTMYDNWRCRHSWQILGRFQWMSGTVLGAEDETHCELREAVD